MASQLWNLYAGNLVDVVLDFEGYWVEMINSMYFDVFFVLAYGCGFGEWWGPTGEWIKQQGEAALLFVTMITPVPLLRMRWRSGHLVVCSSTLQIRSGSWLRELQYLPSKVVVVSLFHNVSLTCWNLKNSPSKLNFKHILIADTPSRSFSVFQFVLLHSSFTWFEKTEVEVEDNLLCNKLFTSYNRVSEQNCINRPTMPCYLVESILI
jgi:hypothetical protein